MDESKWTVRDAGSYYEFVSPWLNGSRSGYVVQKTEMAHVSLGLYDLLKHLIRDLGTQSERPGERSNDAVERVRDAR